MKCVTIEYPKVLRKHVVPSENSNPLVEIEPRKQVEIINQIYLGITLENHRKVIQHLNAKIQSYKSQDKKKAKYDEGTTITSEELFEKLVVSKLICHYCSNCVKIVYNYARDDLQWTLDRVDNSVGHSAENTVICCLKCNLQRRVTDAKKFEFTKKMRIIKGM